MDSISLSIESTSVAGDVRRTIEREHHDLRVVVEGDIAFVRGTYRIVSNWDILDRYQIEIEFPGDYPESLPIVCETGGRIPRLVDRHVSPRTGHACLVVEEDWLVDVAGAFTFKQFMDGPVRNFFLGQSLVEVGQPWPFGERSHGTAGLWEVFADWFDTNDRNAIVRYLTYFTKDRIKGHWPCPCGSGEPIRRCHLDQIRGFQRGLTPTLAKRARLRLVEALDAEAKVRDETARR